MNPSDTARRPLRVRALSHALLILLALVAPCVVARAQVTDPNEAYRVLMQRRAEMSRRAVTETIRRRFEEGRSEGPFPSDAEKRDAAKPGVMRVVSPEERKALTHNAKGVEHFTKNKFEQAIKEYDEAIRIYPALAAAHNNRGSALFALGRLEDAAACFRRAIEIDPKHGQAHFNLALVHIRLGREKEAGDSLTNATRAYIAAGDEHLEAGRLAEAEESYKGVLQIDPDYAVAHFMLGIVYNEAGQHAEAIEFIKRALRKHPNSADAHEALAEAYLGLRKYTEAAQSAERAVTLRPRSPGAHYIAGLAHASLRNRDQALAHLDRLKQLDAADNAKRLAEFIEKKSPGKR
jgi:tetratricopeptide (TPR) repeat protein